MFLGAFVSFFFFFCRGDGVSSLFRDVFSLLFWVPREIIAGVSLVSESSSSFESSSFPDDDVFFLSLTTLLHTPVVLFFPLFHQSAGPPPEKIVTLAGIIAPRMVRERIFKSCRHSRASFFLLLRVLSVSLFARSAPKALLSSSSSSSERAKSFESLFS